MRKDLTELVMILDKSGSMAGLEEDTIGGYNSMLKEQAESGGKVLVSTVLFNERSDVICNRVPLRRVKTMTRRDYRAGGSTALLDAVGGAIRHIADLHRFLGDEDKPEKTIFVIITDGMENASREYSYERVRNMVERQKRVFDWEFIFLGANIDAIGTAGRFGIRADRAANYHSDPRGTKLNYDVLGKAVRRMRESTVPLDASWKDEIDRDYKSRGGKY